MSQLHVAVIQCTSGDVVADNIAMLQPLVAEAVRGGAQLVATPENVFYMRREGTARLADVAMEAHPGILWAQEIAAQHKIWFLVGSIRAKMAGSEKPFNRSVLISPEGKIAASYDKIHLFDVTLPGGQVYAESSQAAAGACAAIAAVPPLTLGLSICYDVRFPALYAALAQLGAQVLVVPAAFTRPTGAAHWHILLKARAIETGSYVLAPAQCGTHPGGRETYGHSLIIDPWGEVLAEASGDAPQVIFAALDAARVEAVRAQIPVLQHMRPIAVK